MQDSMCYVSNSIIGHNAAYFKFKYSVKVFHGTSYEYKKECNSHELNDEDHATVFMI